LRTTLIRKDERLVSPAWSSSPSVVLILAKAERKSSKRVNLDKLVDESADAVRNTLGLYFICYSYWLSKEKSDAEGSEHGSEPPEEDYDVDEEFDNDYAENYFDNGEGDDDDNLGGGDEGGGGTSQDFICIR
jgi:DNA-directed RNA polymerase III subunit RPC7